MKKLIKLAVGLASLAVTVPVLSNNAYAAIVFSDDFEADTFTLNASLNHWAITDGTIDVVGPTFFGINCNGSDKCLDLDGSTGNAGRIESELLSLTLTGNYILSFDLSGNQRGGSDDTVQVFFGATLLDTIILSPSATFANYSLAINVAVPLSGSIIFDHAGGDNFGLILDNVLLVTPSTVPEPMTLGLLGAGLFGLGASRRRR